MSTLAKIAKAIADAFMMGVQGACSLLEWLERKLLGSASGGSAPSYTPGSGKSDIIQELQQGRSAAAEVRHFDPSGLELCKKFCLSTKHQRDFMDLSVLPSDARVLLLTMDDNELKALGQGGPGQIRKFLVGKDHGLHGVPVVGAHKPTEPAKRQSVAERIAWQEEALEMRPAASGFPR